MKNNIIQGIALVGNLYLGSWIIYAMYKENKVTKAYKLKRHM